MFFSRPRLCEVHVLVGWAFSSQFDHVRNTVEFFSFRPSSLCVGPIVLSDELNCRSAERVFLSALVLALLCLFVADAIVICWGAVFDTITVASLGNCFWLSCAAGLVSLFIRCGCILFYTRRKWAICNKRAPDVLKPPVFLNRCPLHKGFRKLSVWTPWGLRTYPKVADLYWTQMYLGLINVHIAKLNTWKSSTLTGSKRCMTGIKFTENHSENKLINM